MNWFFNWKISKKMISAFVLISLLAGVVGVLGITNLSKNDKNYSDMYVNYGEPLGDLGVVAMNFHNIRTYFYTMLLNEDAAQRQNMQEQINALDSDLYNALYRYEKTIQSETMRNEYNQLKETIEAYTKVRTEAVNLTLSGRSEDAMALASSQSDLITKTDTMIRTMFSGKKEQGQVISAQLTVATERTIATMIAVVVIAMVTAILLGVFLSRMISRPVSSLLSTAERIADGDLDVKIDEYYSDEIGQLAVAFSKMTDNLNEVMSNIHAAADQVASGAKQMSESSVLLSQGATEQASSVEQLTVSLEEVSTKIKANADNAILATEATVTARENALAGDKRMQEMLVAMDDINTSSMNISKIIKVIDEIAFQTNILALNAAVEAARAGQHGKGFAVVAEEVRNLAARSANAAKETTEMIEGSIQKVDQGMKIASDTAAALNSIVTDITKMAALARETADSSAEQAVGVEQINQGLLQVSQVIQTNSATSEESAAASEELTGQAEMLNEQVSRFKLRQQAGKGYYSHSYGARARSNYSVKRSSGYNTADEDFAEAAAGMEPSLISNKEFGKY